MKRRVFILTTALAVLGTLFGLKSKPYRCMGFDWHRFDPPHDFAFVSMTRADVPNLNGITLPRAEVEKVIDIINRKPVPVSFRGRLIGWVREAKMAKHGYVKLYGQLVEGRDYLTLSACYVAELHGDVATVHDIRGYTVVETA